MIDATKKQQQHGRLVIILRYTDFLGGALHALHSHVQAASCLNTEPCPANLLFPLSFR